MHTDPDCRTQFGAGAIPPSSNTGVLASLPRWRWLPPNANSGGMQVVQQEDGQVAHDMRPGLGGARITVTLSQRSNSQQRY